MSLEFSINNQRTILAKKLSGKEDTLSSLLIETCVTDIWIRLQNDAIQMSRRFGVLSRFLDNLLDDEGVDHRILEREIGNPYFLHELKQFKDCLDNWVESVFTRDWRLAMRIMWMYQRSPSLKLRLMEARILARLYSVLICWKLPEQEILQKHLYNLFVASYMFCDLKDFWKDKTNLSRLKMMFELASSWVAYLRRVRHPIGMLKIISSVCKTSLNLESEKK